MLHRTMPLEPVVAEILIELAERCTAFDRSICVLQFVIHNESQKEAYGMTILSIRLTQRLAAHLSEEARLSKQPKSLIARKALERLLEEKCRERFLARMAKAAKAIDSEHAAAIAEEALPLDNEALTLTESRETLKHDD